MLEILFFSCLIQKWLELVLQENTSSVFQQNFIFKSMLLVVSLWNLLLKSYSKIKVKHKLKMQKSSSYQKYQSLWMESARTQQRVPQHSSYERHLRRETMKKKRCNQFISNHRCHLIHRKHEQWWMKQRWTGMKTDTRWTITDDSPQQLQYLQTFHTFCATLNSSESCSDQRRHLTVLLQSNHTPLVTLSEEQTHIHHSAIFPTEEQGFSFCDCVIMKSN